MPAADQPTTMRINYDSFFFLLFAPDLDYKCIFASSSFTRLKQERKCCLYIITQCLGRSCILALKWVLLDISGEVNILLRSSFSRRRRRGTKSNDLNIKVRGTKSWSATKRGFIWVAKKGAGGKKRAQGEITET